MLDNETMKYVAGTALAALGTAIGWVRQNTNARIKRIEDGVEQKTSKDDLKRIIEAINMRHEDHVEQDTRRFTGIFNRLDEVAKATARIEGYMQAQQDQRRG